MTVRRKQPILSDRKPDGDPQPGNLYVINGLTDLVKPFQTVEKPLFCIKQDRGSLHIAGKRRELY